MSRQGSSSKVYVRLYFEGRLIPNAGASVMVRGQTNAPLSFQISLVPTNTIKHILAGTWIHVFATDPMDSEPAGDLSDYKLLCEGVVVEKGFSREDGGRQFVVQCVDPSIYWASAKQFWINLTSSGGSIVDQLAVATSGGYGHFGMTAVTGTYGYMLSKLGSPGDDKEERFLDTMISVLDDIGNVNPFYQNVRNRMRITDRILRASAGATDKLFQIAIMSDLLDGIAGRASGQSDLIEIVNELLSTIMHEWVSVPAPPYLNTRIFSRDQFGGIKRTKKEVKFTDKSGNHKSTLFEFETAKDNVVASLIFKPHVYSLSPPSCNVLFPNMYNRMSFNQGFLGEPTRVSMRPQLFTKTLEAATTGLLILRPVELEIFTSITRDLARGTQGLRTPDAKIGDGSGQAPAFHDYDWTTNEERIRGIVYNMINLAPAPATLAISDPGEKQPNGTRKGGMPKYLQNVASYENYKAKFASRQQTLSGPFNMRPVPGFTLLALDDSDANMNLVAYLDSITHNISAGGSATTEYGLKYPRLADEVDYNRPRFKGGTNQFGEIDLDLLRDESGQYRFDRLFDSPNRPPIPGWFSDDFKTLTGLDLTYREWFGDNVRVIESILFDDPERARKALNETFPGLGDLAAQGNANDRIDQLSAVRELNARYRAAREMGNEFRYASSFTNRNFTKIDEAFRFVGAAPREYAEDSGNGVFSFKKNPASTRKVDYSRDKLDFFVGDASPGSGYAGIPEGGGASSSAKMSGAFSVFDTKLHVGREATDAAARAQVSSSESEPSDRARYDGRPTMFDFEFRIWLESLKAAGITPTGEERSDATDFYVTEAGATRPATPDEQAANAAARLADIKAQASKSAKDASQGKKQPSRTKNMTNDQQAPTGDSVESTTRLPLPQPLSEKQVIDLRRAIVDAYRHELETSRGITG